jgi:ribosomal-protein-alanine N-acetyltransferase
MSRRSASSPATLIGPRLTLRAPREEDLEAFLELRRASREFLTPWEPPGPDPSTAETFWRFARPDPAGRKLRWLLARNADGELLGAMTLSEIARGVLQSAILGYWVGAAHARRGYTSEALALLAGHAFGELGLHRLEALVLPENVASKALLEGRGFRREGFSPRLIRFGDAWRDHERWALTAEEWSQERPG